MYINLACQFCIKYTCEKQFSIINNFLIIENYQTDV